MSNNVRVRFAPSPTGPLHIGGVRTALFNFLFAKKHNGSFILRIEDTDQNRHVEGAEAYIIEALNWCGISYDEGPGKDASYGPYKQSQRTELYRRYADQLVAEGKAYYAFDAAEDLNQQRLAHESRGETFIYNWHNRLILNNSLRLDEDQVQEKLNSGASYVIRFKTPQDQTLKLQDLIRGVISVDTNNLDDKVLFKSDGMPTYHLANVVDDHLMEISHVIRGEEWLPSLALHRLLYDALGWKPPEFAHLPLIMKPTGKGKLSKRDGDKLGFPVFPLNWTGPDNKNISMGYREAGYFPEAVINFLAFLGWNPGTEQEIFSLDELISHFDLTRVNKGGARFDPEKIQWYNHHYMQLQNNKDLASHFKSLRSELAKTDIDYIARVIDLIKERATFISDFWSLGYFFFTAPKTYDEKASKKAFGESAAELLAGLIDVIDSVQDFTRERLESEIKAWITNKNVGFGKVMMPLRLALVGALKGPEVFDIIFMIGRFETISRLKKAISVMPKTET